MIFIMNAKGDVTAALSENVHRGSHNASEIVLIAPYAGAVRANLQLPNRVVLKPKSMNMIGSTEVKEHEDQPFYVYVLPLEYPITAISGTVTAQFFITLARYETVNDVQTLVNYGEISSNSIAFPVTRGVPQISTSITVGENDLDAIDTIKAALLAAKVDAEASAGSAIAAKQEIEGYKGKIDGVKSDIDSKYNDISGWYPVIEAIGGEIDTVKTVAEQVAKDKDAAETAKCAAEEAQAAAEKAKNDTVVIKNENLFIVADSINKAFKDLQHDALTFCEEDVSEESEDYRYAAIDSKGVNVYKKDIGCEAQYFSDKIVFKKKIGGQVRTQEIYFPTGYENPKDNSIVLHSEFDSFWDNFDLCEERHNNMLKDAVAITGITVSSGDNYKYTFQLLGKRFNETDGKLNPNELNIGDSVTIDLPLESMIVKGQYSADTGEVVLTMENGNTIRFPVSDMVKGLVSETSFEAWKQTIVNSLNNQQNKNNLIDAEISKLDDSVEKLSNDLNDQKFENQKNAENIEKLATSISNNAKAIKVNSEQISEFERKTEEYSTQLDELSLTSKSNTEAIEEAESKIGALLEKTRYNETALSEHSEVLESLSERTENCAARISENTSDINVIKNDLSDHGYKISNAETEIEGKVDKYHGDGTTNDYGHLYAVSTKGEQKIAKYARQLYSTSRDAIVQRYGMHILVPDDPKSIGVPSLEYNVATSKKYVDTATAPISDHEKRIENLEGTLLTFGEDSSEAYIKSAPAGSAPNVMLNSVGGKTNKSKNLLQYMEKGLRIMAAGEGRYYYLKPEGSKELSNGVSVKLNLDGSIEIHSSGASTTATRLDFIYGGGMKAVEDDATTYIPLGGLQVNGTYTFSVEGSLPDGCVFSAHKFDSSTTNAFSALKSGASTFNMDCSAIECNNIQLLCLQINANTTIDTVIKPMLNEGDTALPYEIPNGITDSAVENVIYDKYGVNRFDFNRLTFPYVTVNFIEDGIVLPGYVNTLHNLLPSDFMAMTGLKPGDTYTTTYKAESLDGTALSNPPWIHTIKKSGGELTLVKNGNTITLPEDFSDENYIQTVFYGQTSQKPTKVTEITITKGTKAAPYTPYSAEQIAEFGIPQAIRDLPDYGKEFTYIDFDRKVFVDAGHDVTFDGSEVWSHDVPTGANTDSYFYTVVSPKSDDSTITPATVSERFKDVIHQTVTRIPKESVHTYNSISAVCFHTDVATTVTQWKAYLQNNPIKVRYRVAEPVETDISHYLTGYDKYKMLSVGEGDIVFENEHKNKVPSTITYVKAKE